MLFPRLALAAALVLGYSVANAQSMDQRMTGTVKSVASDHVIVTTDKGDVDLLVTSDTRIMKSQPASASEIKSGSYLGTANQNAGAGGRATEVHLADNGPDVHAPMNADGLMMTNGHVKSVQTTAAGQEMDVDYGQGTRHVVVPASTPVTRMVPQELSSLHPGIAVTVFPAAPSSGPMKARYILITPAP